ncbi:stage II sporulation protein M [Methanotorris formicicus]|uniref:Stage II sporulation protein M n=1 Tax=Methanotorris formicicus Mc-S-70 TaxID=647171 RepID=H1KZV1_9EURY|nr:stage II sporulation protein M [Methanotorris formicicus]EHP85557.1 protein of unknown function DUF95 transmembrane [Methanotorris formicicus Mc-S-70]
MSRAVYEVLEIMDALKRHKNTIYFTGFTFFFVFVLSYVLMHQSELLKYFGELIYGNFKNRVSSFGISKETSSSILIAIILFNNLSVAVINYLGMVMSIFILITNAFLLSYVLYISDPLKFCLLVLPHGIFEIPALILSASSGLILFRGILCLIISKTKIKPLKKYFEYRRGDLRDSLRIFFVSILLFVIAAVIEGTVTKFISNWL